MSEPHKPNEPEDAPHKDALQKFMAAYEAEHGPQSWDSKLSQKDFEESERAVKENGDLYRTQIRLSPEELNVLIEESLKRALLGLKPSRTWSVVKIIAGFMLSVMGNATWDILKIYLTHHHTFFGADGLEDSKKQSAEAYDQVLSTVPPNLRNFSDEHGRGIRALRVITWRKLADEIKTSEFGRDLSDLKIYVLIESLESRILLSPKQ